MLVLCSSFTQRELLGIKPKNELPAETQEGKNTLGCLVNGEVSLPKGITGGITYNFNPNYSEKWWLFPNYFDDSCQHYSNN